MLGFGKFSLKTVSLENLEKLVPTTEKCDPQ